MDERDISTIDYWMIRSRAFLEKLAFSLLFFILFFPVALILKLLGIDPLRRRLDSDTESYYQPSRQRRHGHMDKPY